MNDIVTLNVEAYLSLRGDRSYAMNFDDLIVSDVPAVRPRVTMIEKLSALHQRASVGERGALISRARDAFDLAHLSVHEPTLESLREQGSTALDIDNRQIRRAMSVSAATKAGRRLRVRRPPGGFADSPVWQDGHPMNRALRVGFQSLGHLVYDKSKKPSFDEVTRRIRAIRDLL